MAEETEGRPKIIIDDDWKERVQAEKEALRREKESPEGTETSAEAMPPASFSWLVTSLATQTLAELGQLAEHSQKPVVRLNQAQHLIDTLGMLEEKTRGNLSHEESAMLSQVLHELRMAYVAVRKRTAQPSNATTSPPP